MSIPYIKQYQFCVFYFHLKVTKYKIDNIGDSSNQRNVMEIKRI